uniref:Transposase Helix-turn-helix domain-containing protein n=1 Tax=Daphnia galeata TaxID=27404 RepID=A0A8J2WH10_9CRUS|nr:unnamed protein product [Daphnia galeata]
MAELQLLLVAVQEVIIDDDIEVLLQRFTLYLTVTHSTLVYNRTLPPCAKLLLFLLTIGNQNSFRAIGDRLGILPGDAHYIFLSTCKVIMDHATNFIRWPERNEYHAISDEFHLPHSVLDGTLIKIAQPLERIAA